MIRTLAYKLGVVSDILSFGIEYEDKQAGLGKRFLKEANELALRVELQPFSYAKLSPRIRIAMFNKFPFGYLFTVSKTQIIITACIPLRSDPRKWRRNSK